MNIEDGPMGAETYVLTFSEWKWLVCVLMSLQLHSIKDNKIML
jgi:hypothetical protein